ncbi:TIGR01777 family oxidoreductase [Aquimarina agarilytica]|uniref:TIGR01777 family oxidoreductase n=1 Tax=Aquimarina agarilytica TaxID=1087449 RepID=UPI000288A34A|nr:TIGR01777 family oxidoreductase [Aquimarina agarilytica]
MSYLITGATGLVGTAIVKLCKVQGIPIHYLTTNRDKIKNSEFCKGFYWNPVTGEIDDAAFEKVSTIIHLAGATVAKRWTNVYKNEIIESRVNSAKLLHDTLSRIEHQVTHFISASAIGIYPNSDTKLYTEETQKFAKDFLGNVVTAWEQSADHFETLGIDVAKLRIGLVLSDSGGALPQMIAPIKKYIGAAFGSGEQWQSWIHVNDLAELFLFLAKNKLVGIYNGVAPNPVTQNKLIRTSAELLKKPLILPNIPKFMARLLLGEMYVLLTSSQRVSAEKVLSQGFFYEYDSVEKALKELL